MNSFSIHFQTYKNNSAVNHCLKEFRRFYPITNIHLISDNGDDFDNIVNLYNLTYTKEKENILPFGRLNGSSSVYEYLRRINKTCEMFDTEWIILFEDDVLTQNYIREFPKTDCAGLRCHRLSPSLEEYIKKINTNTEIIGYGMCGGSIFKRKSFQKCYKNINNFNVDYLYTLDNRITGWSDIPLTVFFLCNNMEYSLWDEIEEPTSGKINSYAAFRHAFKEYY